MFVVQVPASTQQHPTPFATRSPAGGSLSAADQLAQAGPLGGAARGGPAVSLSHGPGMPDGADRCIPVGQWQQQQQQQQAANQGSALAEFQAGASRRNRTSASRQRGGGAGRAAWGPWGAAAPRHQSAGSATYFWPTHKVLPVRRQSNTMPLSSQRSNGVTLEIVYGVLGWSDPSACPPEAGHAVDTLCIDIGYESTLSAC